MRPGFDQHAGGLVAAQHHVIGPFDRHQRRRRPGVQQVGDGQGGDKGDLGRLGRRLARGGQQGGKQIARVALPRPAAPTATGRLATGDDPQRSGLAGLGPAAGVRVGGVGMIEQQDGRGRSHRQPAP